LNTIKRLAKTILHLGSNWICKREYLQQSIPQFNERAVEYGFVFKHLTRIYPRKILDVGTGTTSLPHLMRRCGFLVTAIDNIKDYWLSGMFNRHYFVMDDDITDSKLDDKFDLITCISVLEHLEESEAAIRNMFNLLNPSGYLIITFPYNENKYVRNVYDMHGSSYGQNLPYICQSYSRRELNNWIQGNNWEVIDQEVWQFWDGDHWTVGNQIIPPRQVTTKEKHQLSCILIQKSD
jgi:2-polyprenyl-3-methyl-5-hydroxy-6-metoxy-1,4-benzoquinol methylase